MRKTVCTSHFYSIFHFIKTFSRTLVHPMVTQTLRVQGGHCHHCYTDEESGTWPVKGVGQGLSLIGGGLRLKPRILEYSFRTLLYFLGWRSAFRPYRVLATGKMLVD